MFSSEETRISTALAGEVDRKAGRFVLGPFAFDSEVPLIELRTAEASGERPVSIRLGKIAEDLSGLHRLDDYVTVSADRFVLNIPGIARYLVEDGARVTVELADEAPEADVRGYLLGSVFGALCHQNGLLPLHASAVLGRDGVAAFLGDSGAGKSTTAAFLEQRGHRVISDDICLLDDGSWVIPVAGWLKLWRESFDNLGQVPDEGARVFSQTDKYRRYLEPTPAAGLRLSHVVFLEQGEPGLLAPELLPMSAAEAITELMRLTYLPYIPELTGTRAAQFVRVSAILAHARAYRLRRPWGWDALPATLDLLESTVLGKAG